MRRIAVTAVILLLAAGAQAQVSLQGQWQIVTPRVPAYTGVALIDAQHRVALDDRDKHTIGRSIGYAKVDLPKVEIFLTNRTTVMRIICTVASANTMECRGILPDGRFTVPSVMTRVGPGPESLITPSP